MNHTDPRRPATALAVALLCSIATPTSAGPQPVIPRSAVRLEGPRFVRFRPPPVRHPTAAHRRWNVLLVVMESTGRDYVYQRAEGRWAMPFLHKLAQRSLVGLNHFSPTNTSPRAIFSLLSGLYPMPERAIYAMHQRIYVPSLARWLRRSHHTLFVTPSSGKWYFPRHFVRSSFRRVFTFENLPGKRRAPGSRMAKHEVDTVGFFLQRLRRVKGRPFLAVYYSFVPHWPYVYFGRRYQRYPVQRKRLARCTPQERFRRYLNNLYLLDTQIARIYAFLQAQGLADKTILAFTGDHGEAFYQHPNNTAHSRQSFNENYRTPLIIHQPRLFPPRRISAYTSHVDLLPTLASALKLPYNPRLLQGESLLQRRLSRRYVFLYGNENTLSSIDHHGIKLQIALGRKRRCWVYDLARDPAEKKRLACQAHAAQLQATLAYRAHQRQLLRRYNRASRRRRPFGGQRHPL